MSLDWHIIIKRLPRHMKSWERPGDETNRTYFCSKLALGEQADEHVLHTILVVLVGRHVVTHFNVVNISGGKKQTFLITAHTQAQTPRHSNNNYYYSKVPLNIRVYVDTCI